MNQYRKLLELFYKWLAILLVSVLLAGCFSSVSPESVPTSTLTLTEAPTPTIAPTPTLTKTAMPTSVPTITEKRNTDGMMMIFIPEGTFTMGSDIGEADEAPGHLIYLDSFWIDATEVTNSMYARCVEADSCAPPVKSESYTRDDYYDLPRYADYPVIFVTWDMARAYCEWAGVRLPTEAEWEKSARGADGRIFPWGNEWDVRTVKRLNFADKNTPETTSDITINDGFGDTAPVGSFPRGRSVYGVYDLAGNVWEWVADWYDSSYYFDSPSRNPQGPIEADLQDPVRAMRGGSWVSANEIVFHTSNRNWLEPSQYSESIGFRCAR